MHEIAGHQKCLGRRNHRATAIFHAGLPKWMYEAQTVKPVPTNSAPKTYM